MRVSFIIIVASTPGSFHGHARSPIWKHKWPGDKDAVLAWACIVLSSSYEPSFTREQVLPVQKILLWILRYSTEFIAVWTQQEYTVVESATAAMGEVQITLPAGGSTVDLDVQFTFQDIAISGG